MCKALNVSRSGYYAFEKRPESERSRQNRKLLEIIRRIHRQTHEIYGAPRITKSLPEDMKASRGRVARIMRENGIRSKTVKKYRATTNSNHNLPVAENLLNRNFAAHRPNEKWVADITYIQTEEGWLYLAGVLDLYHRKLVGWAMDSRMKTELVSTALKQAIGRTGAKAGMIVHSDRGVQYASEEYQNLLKKNGFVCSMSRKGNCYDNAPMESFWGKLKTEWLDGCRFKTRADAKKAVFDYIELFYNCRRFHSYNGYLPPLRLDHPMRNPA
jgi:putative transposase